MRSDLLIVHGFSRGGTNVLWNLICSHPAIIGTGIELNQIFGTFGRGSGMGLGWKLLLEAHANTGWPPVAPLRRYLAARVLAFAEENATSGAGQWKTPRERYAPEELRGALPCTKAVSSWARSWAYGALKRNLAIKYIPPLKRAFPKARIIHLVRDGEAQCNGWMRRGCDPRQAGIWYARIAEEMLEQARRWPDEVLLLSFDEVLQNPFKLLPGIQRFAGVEPLELDEFSMKSKRTLAADGTHAARHAPLDAQVWVPAAELGAFLDPDVDRTQKQVLSEAERDAFHRGAAGMEAAVAAEVAAQRAALGVAIPARS